MMLKCLKYKDDKDLNIYIKNSWLEIKNEDFLIADI
jgi:hypothetical protein